MNQFMKFLIAILAFTLMGANLLIAGSYSAAFEQYLADQNTEMASAIITMADQVDLPTLQDSLYAVHADRQLSHETVVRTLQEKASTTQNDLIAELEQLKNSGEVESYHTLWIANIIIVKASSAAFDRLLQRGDVAQISPDYEIKLDSSVAQADGEPNIASVEQALTVIHADQCWAIGITGAGRLISSIDTGVDGNHPAIGPRWAGFDSLYAGHPEWAWFDPVTFTSFPQDWGTHGTFVTGVMCGRNGSDTIGVAVDAHWISAGVIDRVSLPRTVQDALISFQWNADPDGDPATVWDVPDVCCSPWGLAGQHGYPDCDETFWAAIDGMEAAGVVAIFSAGGGGPGASTIVRPADRAASAVNSFCVGAIDNTDPDYPVTMFSSRGPSYCTHDGSADFKPELTGPGIDIRSSIPGNSYAIWSGTGPATAFVAGVVALVRQAGPNLSSDQVKQILLDTPGDLGEIGDDNAYGMGIVNAYEAVLRAQAEIQQWGTLAGEITETPSGHLVEGAYVSVVDRPWSCVTLADGLYSLNIPADTAWIIKIEYPPLCLPVWDTVMVSTNDTLVQNYALEHAVPIILKASFNNPVDASYRAFYIKGSWNSDGLYDPSWSAPYLAIRDNGIEPDQTANDGIFTGMVWLFRDSQHTFNWAIHSENYGGDDSRLQNGADFSIPTYTPPTIPTLSVNPSGHDNNWGLSVCGSPGLNVDMFRGVHGNAYTWGVSAALDSGVTYSFKFCVMHSTVASYPIGAPDIIFDCQFSGAYDFIFNESDETYLIHLSGTGGPPVALTAQSGQDGHIPLHWFPPGTEMGPEIGFDDRTLASGWCDTNYQNLAGCMFALGGDTSIDSIFIHVLTEGDPYWPWPDNSSDSIGISVYAIDIIGNPETEPLYYCEAVAVPGEQIRIGVPYIAPASTFWVMVNNLSGGGDEALGLDAFTDYPDNKWKRIDGVWMNVDDTPGDYMIRVQGLYDYGPGRGPYNIYRDTIPQPYYSQHRINISPQLIPTDFDDWGDDPYGPIINGVTYYYQVSALYEMGGGRFIEVGSSNQAVAIPVDHSCRYIPGDINSDSTFNGLDVTFMVVYFKGGPRPTYRCDCLPDSSWFVAGDVNGNCRFNGLDVTYAVTYFKGGPAPIPCPDCPPENFRQ